MLTALTPLGKVVQGRRSWRISATGYTAAGLVASVSVGVALAAAGAPLGVDDAAVRIAALALALLAAARETGLVALPLPQARRASKDAWARRWGHRRAAILWGLDIGSVFTTWLTFAGVWWLVGLAVLAGDAGLAAELFGVYWLGRAAAIWLGPWLVPSATITPYVTTGLAPQFRAFQLTHAATVLVAGVVTAVVV